MNCISIYSTTVKDPKLKIFMFKCCTTIYLHCFSEFTNEPPESLCVP